MTISRGDIFYADLRPTVGSEQGGIRPVLVVQNNVGNRYAPTIIVIALTSKINKIKLPTHIKLDANSYGLPSDSIILCEQMRTLDKKRLKQKITSLPESVMKKVDNALTISIGLLNRATV